MNANEKKNNTHTYKQKHTHTKMLSLRRRFIKEKKVNGVVKIIPQRTVGTDGPLTEMFGSFSKLEKMYMLLVSPCAGFIGIPVTTLNE